MSRKFFGLMAVAGVALAAGLGGVSSETATAGLFGGGGHGWCGGGGWCGHGGGHCGFEYDDDDACGWSGCGHYNGCGYVSHGHHGHHHGGCYSSCGPVHSAPVSYGSSCGSCGTSTCCGASANYCGGGHCGHHHGGGHCHGGCGGYASSMSYGGCSSCGTSYGVSGGCPGGACGIGYGAPAPGGYGAAPMPMGESYAPAPQGAEEAPAPPAEDSVPPANGDAPAPEEPNA